MEGTTMDPNATLAELRALFARVDGAPVDERASIAEEAAQTFADLDVWIMAGGFVPDAWVLDRRERNLAAWAAGE